MPSRTAVLTRAGLPAALRFEGHAIVSADGRIAAADGSMPKGLHNPADWQRFQAALDESVLVVLGRLGHERHPNPGRPRLVLTTTPASAPAEPFVTRFDPAQTELGEVLAELGIAAGTVAVTGGTSVFDTFLPLYDSFALAEVHDFVLPVGLPCFSTGHPRAVLAAAGLAPARFELIDAANNVSLTHWLRR